MTIKEAEAHETTLLNWSSRTDREQKLRDLGLVLVHAVIDLNTRLQLAQITAEERRKELLELTEPLSRL